MRNQNEHKEMASEQYAEWSQGARHAVLQRIAVHLKFPKHIWSIFAVLSVVGLLMGVAAGMLLS